MQASLEIIPPSDSGSDLFASVYSSLVHPMPYWTPFHTRLLCASVLVHSLLYRFAKGRFDRGRYSDEVRTEGASRVVSTVVAFYCVAGSLFMFRYQFPADVWQTYATTAGGGGGYVPLLDWLAPVFCGYFVYDILLCVTTPSLRHVATLLHHAWGIVGILVPPSLHIWSFVVASSLLTELSTPFVNFHFFLRLTSPETRRKWFALNAGSLALTFFAMRIVWLNAVYLPFMKGPVLYQWSREYGAPLFYITWGAMTSALLLNYRWAYLIGRMIVRHVRHNTVRAQKRT